MQTLLNQGHYQSQTKCPQLLSGPVPSARPNRLNNSHSWSPVCSKSHTTHTDLVCPLCCCCCRHTQHVFVTLKKNSFIRACAHRFVAFQNEAFILTTLCVLVCFHLANLLLYADCQRDINGSVKNGKWIQSGVDTQTPPVTPSLREVSPRGRRST